MKNTILKPLRDERGATAVGYGMIIGLIVAAITVIVGKLGTQLNTVFTNICTTVKGGTACQSLGLYSHIDIAGWASVAILTAPAIALDIRSRYVPNWLVVAEVTLSIALIKFGGVQDLAYD